MLSLVTAAEQLYRLDAAARARENALIVAIRDREAAVAAALAQPARPTAVRTRTTWARPIGVRLERAQTCDVACATA